MYGQLMKVIIRVANNVKRSNSSYINHLLGYGDDVVSNKNPEKFKIISKPCDKKADLFMLQHEHLSAEGFDAPPPAGSTIRLGLRNCNGMNV